MVNFSDREAREIEQALILTRAEIGKLNKALAEKDREIEEIRSLLGCHPAYIADTIRDLVSKTEQIPNIDRVRIAESDLRELHKTYHALMVQAVRFARALEQIANEHGLTGIETRKFLDSSEAQALLNEKEQP